MKGIALAALVAGIAAAAVSADANAVRFYIDEVIKAGTDNSTPQN